MKTFLKLIRAVLLLSFGATVANAAEFSCQIANKGRVVNLVQKGNTVAYAYGKENATPELALTVPLASAELYAWEGMGRYQNYSIGIPNGQFLYTVYKSFDSREQVLVHGVVIEKNEKLLADLLCHPDTVVGDLEGMVLKLKGVD